jgi:hypothetical protein
MTFAIPAAIKIPSRTFAQSLRVTLNRSRYYSIGSNTVPAAFQVFNRETKRKQKERAASNVKQSRQVDYVKDEVAFRVVDRLLVRRALLSGARYAQTRQQRVEDEPI